MPPPPRRPSSRIIDITPEGEEPERRPLPPRPGVGAVADLPGDLGALIPEALKPHVVLITPLGTTIIDPLISLQDDSTQQVLQNLGIEMHVIFGPVPDELLTMASDQPLGQNLMLWGGLAALGLFLLLKK